VTNVVAVDSLVKAYDGRRVVDGVSFSVPAGECFGILGPNGAGKTTTMRCVLGLASADGGSIQLAGFSVPGQARNARYRVGVVPQFDNLDPDFTVEENLVIWARYFDISRKKAREAVPQLLEFAGLSERAGDRIDSLSGGMKRRLTIARALINEPDVIFLDEPTTGLDPQARHLVWDGLRGLIKAGKTLILTTHFMDEAERLCDRLCVMDQGKIIAMGSPRSLIESNIEPTVIELFGEGVQDWADQCGRHLSLRVEISGETVFCYTRSAETVMESLKDWPQLRAMRRAANLEDVFIKLTGRDIRD
jgi:lipooligosaccharide transport system ATP-binding protein